MEQDPPKQCSLKSDNLSLAPQPCLQLIFTVENLQEEMWFIKVESVTFCVQFLKGHLAVDSRRVKPIESCSQDMHLHFPLEPTVLLVQAWQYSSLHVGQLNPRVGV